MTVFQALVLGIVQGVTEFLPISSSGFLILVPEVFGWNIQNLAFDAFVHLATLAAIILALWEDIKQIPKQLKNRTNNILVWIILATVPVMFVGYFGESFIEQSFRSIEVVAWSFIVWGAVLYIVDRYAPTQSEDLKNVGIKRSFLVGLAQVIALIPGTSRSGITITAGIATGLTRDVATRFAFLLGIPTIAAAGGLKLVRVAGGMTSLEFLPAVVGTLAAFFTALFTVKFLLRFLKTSTYAPFAYIRIILGVILLLV